LGGHLILSLQTRTEPFVWLAQSSPLAVLKSCFIQDFKIHARLRKAFASLMIFHSKVQRKETFFHLLTFYFEGRYLAF
jgi:hypothetical protein